MRKRQVQIVVLCEDDEHWSFVLNCLLRCGYSRGKIRPPLFPAAGKGSGKSYVQREYPKEVRAARKYRKKNQSETYALVVVIDQDTPGQPVPFEDLDNRLVEAGLPRRAADEKIAIFAPRYCVETWVRHLLNERLRVDEETDYSKPKWRIGKDECRRAGATFAGYIPPDDPRLPSLARGYIEKARILRP